MENNDKTINAAIENLESLKSIFSNIIYETKHQLTGNCATLIDQSSLKTIASKESSEEIQIETLIKEERERVDILIKRPVDTSFKRLRGLLKIFDDIKQQIEYGSNSK